MTVQRKSQQTVDFESVTETLSVRAKRVLMNLGVNDTETLLRLRRVDLKNAWSCGKKTIAEIDAIRTKLQPSTGLKVTPAPQNALDFDNVPREIFEAVPGALSVRGSHILEDIGVDTLKAFMLLDRAQLLNCRNCGRKTADEILRIQAGIKEFAKKISNNSRKYDSIKVLSSPCLRGNNTAKTSNANRNHLFADVENPASWLHEWVLELSRSERQAQAFMLRKGMLACAPMTFDRVGEQIGGLSRERARQLDRAVEKRASTQFQQKRLRSLINAATAFVRQRGGMVELDELTNALLCKGKDGDQLTHATKLISFFSTLKVWKDAGLILQKNGVVKNADSWSLIRRLADMIEDVASGSADEKLSKDLWSIDRNHLKYALQKKLSMGSYTKQTENISDTLLDAVINKCKERIRVRKGRVLSVGLWRLRFGSVVKLLDTVLGIIGKPAHFSEVADHAAKWRPGILERNVHAALDRSKNALLWDRGTFVHKDKIVIPLSLIHDVENWLLKVLQEDVPFVSVNGAFMHFLTRCKQAAFPSEVALYTCLRKSAHQKLIYPRLPLVYLKKGYTERIPLPIAFEDFVRDAGGAVPQREAREFGIKKIYLKDYQFYNLIQRISNVIRTADWGFLHLDNAKLDQESLLPLITYTQDVLAKEEHCAVEKIYLDKRVTCRSLGIDGPVMLYSILQYFADDLCSLDCYPRVARSRATQKNGRFSIRKRVIDFVRDSGKPCPYEVLEKRFVEQLGYKEQQVYSVSLDTEICLYHAGCVIHHHSLEWNESKQERLERVAFEIYSNAIRAGGCFGRISYLLESSSIPELPTGLYWSRTMIADLLAKGKKYIVLGNTREAFLPRDNEQGIYNFESLVGKLLNRDWGGSANLAAFEGVLVKDGIIKKRLTPVMLGSGQTVVIMNKEITLRELLVDA